jgi:hypothetical protein
MTLVLGASVTLDSCNPPGQLATLTIFLFAKPYTSSLRHHEQCHTVVEGTGTGGGCLRHFLAM